MEILLRKWKEYTVVKQTLEEKRIDFQMPFAARLQVFYEGEMQEKSGKD